jgi:NAD(P)-dependent dehydrogenase (short-subunit alcohol dehydrogenase family)
MEEFENRVAIVTGTTGIARAIAKRLATGGCRVVSCGIEAVGNAELEQEAKKLGLSLRVELCDVSQPEQVRSVVARQSNYTKGSTSSSMPPRFILSAPRSRPTRKRGTAA